jgi:tRNA threonylcarbamoyladenosine biosynthesis protein TsaE
VGDVIVEIATAAAMERLGGNLAKATTTEGVIYFLYGELGSGKTTLVRGFLRALGYEGTVKSPTYTLVEPYRLGVRCVYHFDLYRIADPEELDYLGIRDYFDGRSLCLIEWPERGGDQLRRADLEIRIRYQGMARRVVIEAGTTKGKVIISSLNHLKLRI